MSDPALDPAAPPADPAVPPAAPAAPAAPAGFLDSFSPDVRTALAPKNFDSGEALGKAYLDLERKFHEGGEKLAIPGEKATDEERAAFHEALGRPKTVEEYDLGDFAPPEGMPWSEDVQGKVFAAAHAAGLNSAQLRAVAGAYADAQAEGFKAINDMAITGAETTVAELRKTWGDAFDVKNDFAQRTVAELFGKDLEAVKEIRLADGTFLLDNAAVAKAMAEVGEVWAGEGKLPGVEGGRRFSMTPAEAEAKIAELKGDKDFQDKVLDATNIGHKEAMEQMQHLREIVTGGRR